MKRSKTNLGLLTTIHPEYTWISERISPEHMLLWGVLERAIRDLCIRDPENLIVLAHTIHWFKGTHADEEIFSYEFVADELQIKKRTREYIKALLKDAKAYVCQSVSERKAGRKRSIFMAAWGRTSLS